MALIVPIKLKRGTRATIAAAAAANGLLVGEPYVMLDEARLSVGLSPNTYEDMAKLSELNDKVDKVAGKGLSTEDYSTAEKSKLAGIAPSANNYSHPTGDGNLHVPANSTTNNGKVLMASATAGVYTWTQLTKTNVGLNLVDNTADASKAVLSATKLTTPRTINGTAFDGSGNITINAVDATARIASSEKGAVNGVATLGVDGKVPAVQLPSFVDDVLEVANFAALPVTGESGKIYVTLDNNKIWRWSGSAYIEISPVAGNADTATKLATARSIAATGDIGWSVTFDGSANVSSVATLANTGVGAGTFKSVTVDAKGRVTAGTNPTTLAGYGITDAAPVSHTHTASQISDSGTTGRALMQAASVAAALTTLGLDSVDGGSF